MDHSNKTFHRHTKEFISNRTIDKQEVTKWVNSTFITIIGLIVFLFIYYLWTINANATLWYDIRDLEIQISQLRSQKDIVETKIDKIKSLDNISRDAFSKTDMEYIKDSESLVIKESVQYVYNN
jgi:hypothetical protein